MLLDNVLGKIERDRPRRIRRQEMTDRQAFLVEMYKKMWDNIDRHINLPSNS